MDVNFEKIFAIIVLRFVPMQCILIKREFEDENFMDSKVTVKSTALKIVAYMVIPIMAILISTLEMSNILMSCHQFTAYIASCFSNYQ